MDNKDIEKQPKLPPKSRFNDEESTAVLRLLVKQKKLLKNMDENPALRLTPEKSVRHLPPVTPELGEETRAKENSGTHVHNELSHYNHLPACISGENSRPVSAGGIYRSPKLARAKERPKVSYGRRSQQQQEQQQPQQQQQQKQQQKHYQKVVMNSRLHNRTYSYEQTISNLKEQTLKMGAKTAVSRTRSCPVGTHIPPINSPNKHSISTTIENSLSQMKLTESGQFHSQKI